jgi:hypothetical protein
MLSCDTYFLMAEKEYTALFCHDVINTAWLHFDYTGHIKFHQFEQVCTNSDELNVNVMFSSYQRLSENKLSNTLMPRTLFCLWHILYCTWVADGTHQTPM